MLMPSKSATESQPSTWTLDLGPWSFGWRINEVLIEVLVQPTLFVVILYSVDIAPRESEELVPIRAEGGESGVIKGYVAGIRHDRVVIQCALDVKELCVVPLRNSGADVGNVYTCVTFSFQKYLFVLETSKSLEQVSPKRQKLLSGFIVVGSFERTTAEACINGIFNPVGFSTTPTVWITVTLTIPCLPTYSGRSCLDKVGSIKVSN